MHCCSSDSLNMILQNCGSQCLASLTLVEDEELWHQRAYNSPQTELQLPEALPRLRQLHFGSCFDWDAMSVALWPLAILAARSTGEHEGECGASTACAGDAMFQPTVASPVA